MKKNWNQIIMGTNIALIPYKKMYVPLYISWMQDEYVRSMTASEDLPEEDWYNIQKSWKIDERSYTFLIMKLQNEKGPVDISNQMTWIDDYVVGDVNLFLNQEDDLAIAEVDVMIGHQSNRGKKFSKEAVILMIHYGIIELGIQHFFVKISVQNEISINLFESLGFKKINFSEAFQEFEYQLEVNNKLRASINNIITNIKIIDFVNDEI